MIILRKAFKDIIFKLIQAIFEQYSLLKNYINHDQAKI